DRVAAYVERRDPRGGCDDDAALGARHEVAHERGLTGAGLAREEEVVARAQQGERALELFGQDECHGGAKARCLASARGPGGQTTGCKVPRSGTESAV